MDRHRKYSDEFKREAVAQAESGRNVRQLARELGLSPGLIYKWRERYQVVEEQLEPSAGRAESAQVRELKRQLAIMTQERDILKKAIQVFSRGER